METTINNHDGEITVRLSLDEAIAIRRSIAAIQYSMAYDASLNELKRALGTVLGTHLS